MSEIRVSGLDASGFRIFLFVVGEHKVRSSRLSSMVIAESAGMSASEERRSCKKGNASIQMSKYDLLSLLSYTIKNTDNTLWCEAPTPKVWY